MRRSGSCVGWTQRSVDGSGRESLCEASLISRARVKPRGQFDVQFLQPSQVYFVGGGDRLDLSFQVCRKHAEGFLYRSKRAP